MKNQKNNPVVNLLKTASYKLCEIILVNISEAVFITDCTGNFKFICPNVYFIFKYTSLELLSFKNIRKITGNTVYNQLQLKCKDLKLNEEIIDVECLVKNAEDNLITVLINVKKIAVNNKQYFLYTLRDISKKRKLKINLLKTVKF